MKQRILFCQLCPAAYQVSVWKCRMVRNLQNLFCSGKLAKQKSDKRLPVVVYKHNSLMRRKLGNVNLALQEHKVTNLNIAAPKVCGIVIQPGEIFSFWKLVGACSAKKGYQVGLIIKNGQTSQDIGGGMCQFTNLIHWLVLHTPLDIVEHHHHDMWDLFPDYGRTVPFGTGTSIFYNYLDYRFQNNTAQPYQLWVYTNDVYLCGEIRTTLPLNVKYHIKAEDERFICKENDIFRTGKIFRECVDKATGTVLFKTLIKTNYAKVMYPKSQITAPVYPAEKTVLSQS